MSMINNVRIRTGVAGHCSRVKVLKNRAVNYGWGLVIGSVLVSVDASAAIPLADVSSAYRNCTYIENNGAAIIGLTIDFNAAAGNTANGTFSTRGVMIYAYDENGVLKNSAPLASFLQINDVSATSYFLGEDYVVYNGTGGPGAGNLWWNHYAFTANVVFYVALSKIAAWPAVAVRASNYTYGGAVGEVKGVAYIGPSTKGGNCSIIVDPELPPPAVTPIVTMTAPDWDLGELPRGGETVLILPATKDQLCFNYEGSTSITNQKYLINATNTNGLSANGRYLLKSLEDSSQTVPYTLTLANSTDSVVLPNTLNRLFSLDAGGRTCFTPTFNAQPDRTVAGGAYSDILTFTVVAKP